MAAGVDHLGRVDLGYPGIKIVKFLVNMSMDKIGRPVFCDEPSKACKTHVAWIIAIMNVPGRGMGHHHVNGPFAPQTKSHPEQLFFHPGFSILIGSAVIPHGPAHAHDVQGAKADYPAMDIFTSHKVGGSVPDIVVAFNIKQGAGQFVS